MAVGPKLGLEIPLNRNSRLVLAASATWRHYSDARIFRRPSFAGTSGNAWRYGIRVGIGFGETP